MFEISGIAFDAKTSLKKEGALRVDTEGLCTLDDTKQRAVLFTDIKISPRLGDSTRFLTLPGGQLFETDSNDLVDDLIAQFGEYNPSQPRKLLYLPVLVLVLVMSWLAIHQGLPSIAHNVAMSLPQEMVVEHGRTAFESIDEVHFTETELSEERQEHLQLLFQDVLPTNSTMPYKLHIRESEEFGANAFALPSGDIIVTGDLIALTENNKEFQAVMLHEIAHVEKRHAVRSAVQTSALLLCVVAVSGDIASLSTVLLGMPAILLDSNYSRRMELEADEYVLEYLKEKGEDPMVFASIFEKIVEDHKYRAVDEGIVSEKELEDMEGGYFSSHPPSEERLEKFRQAAER